jgi:hypothetical protein
MKCCWIFSPDPAAQLAEMDLVLTPAQRAVGDLARKIFTEPRARSGISVVRGLLARSGLDALLGSAGSANQLLQALIAEAAGGAVLECSFSGLAVGASLRPGWVVAVMAGPARWARFPADIDHVAVRQGETVTLHRVGAVQATQVRWGDPFGEIVLGEVTDGGGDDVLAWSRFMSAAEAVGAAAEALELTWRYMAHRQQFGARLVDRQVVRHRLGEIEIELNAARLLVYEAAWLAPHPYPAALAAAAVSALSRGLVPTLHRLTGAIGLTAEYPLARYTGRVRSVARELGSPEQLCREIAQLRRRLIRPSGAETSSHPVGDSPP